MLYTLVVLAGVFNYVFAAPLSSCLRQADCIDASITELDELDDNDNVQYEICLIFDATLDECVKDEKDEISHACVAGEDGIVSSEDGEKLEGLASGRDDALCDIVPCGVYTTFGLKDGPSCELDSEFLYANLSIPDYNHYLMCYSGMSCNANGKNSKACKWAIRAPDCPQDTTTFEPISTTPEPTTSDPTTANPTTAAPTPGQGYTPQPTMSPVTDEPTTSAPTPAECQCWYDGQEVYVEPTDCTARCGGYQCEFFGEGMCRNAENPPANAAVYVRSRANTNDLVVVDQDTMDDTTTEKPTDGNTDTNPDTNSNPDTNPDTTDVSAPETDKTASSGAGVIGVSMVGLLSFISYLLQ